MDDVSKWTDAMLEAERKIGEGLGKAYGSNPQYGGGLVAGLCAEVLRLRALVRQLGGEG